MLEVLEDTSFAELLVEADKEQALSFEAGMAYCQQLVEELWAETT